MRRFSSYGPVNPKLHFYAPREALIDKACAGLMGENPLEDGHYITVWAPRQCGKTWVMQEAVQKIKKSGLYEIGIFSIESLKKEQDPLEILTVFVQKLSALFQMKFPPIKKIREIPLLFTRKYFRKPVILIIDEFDALEEEFINSFAGIFRDMFIGRTNERDTPGKDKTNLLHGIALVGVRSVLGIENVKGSPFNIQRSLHIPNLTFDEVKGMIRCYENESKQTIQPGVVDTLYYETKGQPGLTCWLAELLTETYNEDTGKPLTMENFQEAYAAAVKILPNNNILNIISKANKAPYMQKILDLFKTDRKIEFTYDDSILNYLYMNGVIDREKVNRTDYFVKFPSPFVQKRLFNYFSREIFPNMGRLYEQYENLDAAISESHLDIGNLLNLYEAYLKKNRAWLLKDAPRRADMRIYEAVYHFNLYSYLKELLKSQG
ncbi:MAG: hypothetical protein GY757_41625, partial [bacterium]|nr:hypothetical protein [bacterium]